MFLRGDETLPIDGAGDAAMRLYVCFVACYLSLVPIARAAATHPVCGDEGLAKGRIVLTGILTVTNDPDRSSLRGVKPIAFSTHGGRSGNLLRWKVSQQRLQR